MKKLYNKLIDAKYALYASATTAIMLPSVSHAQLVGDTTFTDIGGNVKTQMEGIAPVITLGAAFLGTFFVITGILKLKAAAESQGQQVKYSEGIWRIAIGSMLIGGVTIAGTGMNSLLGGETGADVGRTNVNTLFAD